MKKILLSLVVVASSFGAQSQVVVAGVSPAAVQGNYDFGVQANAGWPSYTAGSTTGEFWGMTIDFGIPGTFIMDTLMLAETGEPGLNPQGNPISQEACDTVINDLTGKIAVVYRNTCDFALKVKMCEDAGAIAVIIINREDDTNLIMTATDTGEGPNTTLPAVMVSNVTGSLLVGEMAAGPVVMLIGNKISAFTDDVGANRGELLISPYGGANSMLDNGFDLGIQLYNFGSNPQSNITVTATIDGPSGQVYNNVINAPTMNMEDTLSIFNGNPYAFPPFDLGGIGNYPAGDYTLTYSIDLGVPDLSDFDNVFVSTFTVNPDVISLAGIDGSNIPVSTGNPSNTEGEYQSCMFFQDPDAGNLGLLGVHLTPHADSAELLVGEEIFVNIYEWNDAWVDLNDPNYVGGANNDWFTQLSNVAFEAYYPQSIAENDVSQYVPLTTPIPLVSDQRYLICTQTFNPEIKFGYDNGLNYDGNQGISAMPISPIAVEQTAGTLTWFTGGWNGSSAPSIGLKVVDVAVLGLDDVSTLSAKAYPNPANDVVTVSVEANGNASLTVTDIAGKHAMESELTLVNGSVTVDISALDAGVYIFNLLLEDGQTSQFNVVKK